MQKTYDKPYDYEEDKYEDVDYSCNEEVLIDCRKELVIELDYKNAVTISLLDGLAEVFGAELPPENPVYFSKGSKFAVFTWHKAKILITGHVDSTYIRSSTTMQNYLEIHANIQEDRENALIARAPGPNVVVCGSPGSGKSTLCKILINYALKMGNKPVYIDLDIENNEIVPAGCIGATKVKMPLPNDDLNEDSICMYYGFKTQIK